MVLMAKNLETVRTGWPIPVRIKEQFTEFCAGKESVAQADCAGALFLWQYMPPNIREWAKLEAKDEPTVGKGFWSRLGTLIEGSTPMLLEAGDTLKEKKSAKSA